MYGIAFEVIFVNDDDNDDGDVSNDDSATSNNNGLTLNNDEAQYGELIDTVARMN